MSTKATVAVSKPVDLKPRITVIGVGGAGGNAVNNMIQAGLPGVDFIAANTDAQALLTSKAGNRIQLGIHLTEGLGAGSKPEIGEAAAKEAEAELRTRLAGTHMLFLAAGMGGGTGTGATSVVARIAKDLGILTVAVVTKPFTFEGTKRMRTAEAGIADLHKHVDTLIVIPNQNLFRLANEKTTFSEAFLMADQVLYSGIACIVDLIVKDGLINLDLADVRTVLMGMGPAVMGTGEAAGERRAVLAAEEAIHNQLLDNMSLAGAKGLLLSIIGGTDMTLFEVDEAASRVRAEVDPEANIIVGAAFDETMKNKVRVSIVASGMPMASSQAPPAQSPTSSGARVPNGTASAPAPKPVVADHLGPMRAPITPPPLPLTASRNIAPPPVQAPSGADRGSDGVRVRDQVFSDPALLSTGSLLGQPESKSESVYTPPSSFEARMLSEPRRAASRVPDVSEFPPIGQKEYREKMAQFQAEAAAPEIVRAPALAEPVQEPRKGRFFQRLAEATLGRPKGAGTTQVDAGADALPDFFVKDKRA